MKGSGSASRIATSRSYHISYEDTGEGSPIVVIPGSMQSAADYREAGYLDGLSPSRRVLLVDPLGHGQSEKPHQWEAYRWPDVAMDVIAVMDASGLDKVALWGYSRGAALAAMIAIEYPERVSALILGGAALTNTVSPELPPWVESISKGDWPGFWSSFPLPVATELKLHFEKGNDPKAIGAAFRGRRQPPNYSFDLRRVSAPALVYCGEEDNAGSAIPTAQGLGVELEVVKGRDHFGACNDVGAVMPLALAFLKTADPRR